MSEPQTFKNHVRFDPPFHFVAVPLMLLCFIASIVHVVHQASPANVLLVPLSFASLLTVILTRRSALKAQDRTIRLEETLRMQRLGIDQEGLTLQQIVALRFASDEELAALAKRARTESLSSKQIKQAIVTWRPDYDRV
jgi:hypothetical protein